MGTPWLMFLVILKGILWSGVAFSIIVVVVRLGVRIRLFGRLKVDDYLVVCAIAFNIASALVLAVLGDVLYVSINPPTDQDRSTIAKDIAVATHDTLASYLCYYLCLWSFKLSFMAFFYGLGRQIRALGILW
ncbi:uncharacterized protein PG998_004563 [Apiospora kogelbergensis]|uniref:uncharacterized protein n=1 Tax=Apiospora kogelbergensis TaxID=1337665 RepID=UPI003130ECD4